MGFKFEIGKSYYVLGGFKFKVLARSSNSVWGYMYCKDFDTTIFRKKIHLDKDEEVLKLGRVVFCGAKYFSRG